MNRYMSKVWRAVAVVMVLVVGVMVRDAQAQQGQHEATVTQGPPLTFDTPLSKVYITDHDGTLVQGTLVSLGSDVIVVMVGEQTQSVPWADVAKLERRGDGVKDGALTGLAIGGGIPLVAGLLAQKTYQRGTDQGQASGLWFAFVAFYMAPIGTAAGVLFDAMVVGRTTVYTAPKPAGKSTSRVSLSSLSRERVAARWQLTW